MFSDNFIYNSRIWGNQPKIKRTDNMTNEKYILRNNDKENLCESTSWYEIKEELIGYIVDDMWECDKTEIINNCYGSVEIAGTYYDTYDIILNLGDVDDTLRTILNDEFDNLDIPNVGESVEIIDYGGFTIECVAIEPMISCEISFVSVVDGSPVINTDIESMTNDNANFKILDLFKEGYRVIGDIYRTEATVRACMVKDVV